MLLDLSHDTAVIVQGISGRMGQTHAKLMQRYGTRIVGGTSSRPPSPDDAFPVFPDCAAAVAATGAQLSLLMVPPLQTLAAVEEAVHAGLRAVVTVGEGVPVLDALRIRALTREAGVTWLGASTPGMCIPGELKFGFLPDVSLAPGRIGVMSRAPGSASAATPSRACASPTSRLALPPMTAPRRWCWSARSAAPRKKTSPPPGRPCTAASRCLR